MVIVIQLLVALVGILMWFVCTNPKLQELGRIAFFCGLLTFLMDAHATIGILNRQ